MEKNGKKIWFVKISEYHHRTMGLLKQKLKGLISIEIYIHVFLILVLDDYILVDVGKVSTPKISPSSVKTNMDVQTFIDDFMEGTSLISGANIESIGAFNAIKAP